MNFTSFIASIVLIGVSVIGGPSVANGENAAENAAEELAARCAADTNGERRHYSELLSDFQSAIQGALKPDSGIRKALEISVGEGQGAAAACAWPKLAEVFMNMSGLLATVPESDLKPETNENRNYTQQLSTMAVQNAIPLDINILRASRGE